MIRGMSIEEALKQLQFVNKKGAQIASEALREAQQMAVRDHNVEFKNNLWVGEWIPKRVDAQQITVVFAFV